MSEINYQALRIAAENATPGEWCTDDYGVIADAGLNANYYIASCSGPDNRANKRFIAAANPATVLALLDEREAQSKRIAELETNLAALSAENAGLNKFIVQSCYVFDGEQDELSDAYICAIDGRMPQIPATDAFLSDVRAGAFNDLCAAFVRHAKVAGLDDADTVTLKEVTEALLHCAEQIRAPE
ncbi:ead/Ea22-like family protein [Salmonella enterica subsp. enterica serovar Newport]|nr:ead/Ea22-like family protein [Salmonella enterica subsp. enterica serovar Newport]EBS2389656.1 ead/Ea22-like family protein [Salmonella enterica subsp. enterica serovar Newport]ECA8780755.1 ead/Ea22-like family protein [Salmonella enterica subsp. enterica serovar Newport]ECD2004775.1 ead/Ea22-like family protein [Salmonella enterica subsp. enterica serovar Newport]EDI0785108.1 ead/Ea22-like family protein [Salmonella enterica subsp. enterica serovar Kasenyi]